MLRQASTLNWVRLLWVAALGLGSAVFAGPEKWSAEINLYTNTDENDPPMHDAVVFIGGASIGKWRSLSTDFPSAFTINRGFGGAELSDCSYYADRIIIPYHPRFVVVSAGEEDLLAGKTPETVLAEFEAFCTRLQSSLPQARILFLAIKQSPATAKFREEILHTDALIAAACAKNPQLAYVDVATPLLDAAGKTRPELFLDDQRELKSAGYAIWTKTLTPFLRPQ